MAVSKTRLLVRKWKRKLIDCARPALWVLSVMAMFAAAYASAKFLFPPRTGADVIRWAGLLLQIAGIYAVALNLDKSLRLFGERTLGAQLWSWAADILKVPRPIHRRLAAEPGNITIKGSSASMSYTRGNRTTEERLAALEEERRASDESMRRLQQSVADLDRKAERLVRRQGVELGASIAEVRSDLKKATIGGVKLSLAGLFYLLFGIWFATLPEEMSAALKWMCARLSAL